MASSPLVEIFNYLSVLLLLLTASSCGGRDIVVVDTPSGWKTYPYRPPDNFDFDVNDTLIFIRAHANALLWVARDKFEACNTTQPFIRIDGDEPRFVLSDTGFHYFISADAGLCRDGVRFSCLVASQNVAQQVPHDQYKYTRSFTVALKQTGGGVLASCLALVAAAVVLP